ncbi:MAG: hypothetical protein DI589_13790 [Shinella sp.]|nr:MAG: hypothetical protein DI589_13790 [Shinella sp.]
MVVDLEARKVTDEQIVQSPPFVAVFPARRSPKTQISVRLPVDVIDALKATGPGWRGRRDDALRKAEGLKRLMPFMNLREYARHDLTLKL